MRTRLLASAIGLPVLLFGCGAPAPSAPVRQSLAVRQALHDPSQIDAALLAGARRRGVTGIVLCLGDRAVTELDRRAADLVRSAGLQLGYWLEVGRSVALANARPDLMASLQGHREWRQAVASAPSPGAGEVVKAWPWLPVAYREAFDLHLARVRRQLVELPVAEVVYLSDLQGPPSSCGCGNALCRWATDYTLHGAPPLRSAELGPPGAAARFVAAVRAIAPASRVIPVWVTECEEVDRNGPCRGVGCYHGACWREFDKQWSALVGECRTVALLLPHASFGRPVHWPRAAVEHLRGRVGNAVRLIAVVEGGSDPIPGVEVLLTRHAAIPQGFEPRIVHVPK
ncbi:MAG: hypothetical protein H6836_02130 [Planctomycetes bacterium]|nr:hypothetical protein [Planctomycetota bacterium]